MSRERKLAWLLLGMVAITLIAINLFVPDADAATIHTPADGAVAQEGQPVYFDWRWSDGEWATARIGFARSPDGPWAPQPELSFRDCSYGSCGTILDSHLSVSALPPGDWWWTLCHKTLDGEDDKCYRDANPPRKLTIVAKPPPVVAAPPVAVPAPPATAPAQLAAPYLRYARGWRLARSAARDELLYERVRRCVRRSRTSMRCWTRNWRVGVWTKPNGGGWGWDVDAR